MIRLRFRPRPAHLIAQGIIIAIALAVFANRSDAQVQQAWIARYNNGITNGQHQALKMALGSDGNIYVCGFSQNANSNLDYAVLKYASNGNLLWVSRLDSTNTPQARPVAFSLDTSNNSVITGDAGTIKFDSAGRQVWQASYAGLTVATDPTGCAYVGGYSQNFAVTKLSPSGSKIWTTTYVDSGGPTVSQSVLVDSSNNVYVSGLDSYDNPSSGPPGPYVYLTTIRYDATGAQLWKSSVAPAPQFTSVRVRGAASDNADSLYVVVDWPPVGSYATYKYTANGSEAWSCFPTQNANSLAHNLSVDVFHNVYLTGQVPPGQFTAYGTYKISPSGTVAWADFFPSSSYETASVAFALALASNCVYVVGYSRLWGTSNDIVTIAYDTNGKQLWLQRYDGPAHGDDEGNAICVDTNGNVYVAGYDTPVGGGTEMVLIKYSPVTVKHEANGDFQLQAQGAASEPFDIQATTNLSSWQDLGDFDADTNGVLQFTDTNAGQYPWRFYQAIPQ